MPGTCKGTKTKKCTVTISSRLYQAEIDDNKIEKFTASTAEKFLFKNKQFLNKHFNMLETKIKMVGYESRNLLAFTESQPSILFTMPHIYYFKNFLVKKTPNCYQKMP